MDTIESNTGFDGRTFLTEEEWRTYLRRKPVRYIDKKRDKVCGMCGKPEGDRNPLQNAHRISFGLGLIYLALTPDFLDGDDNIVTAHRKQCNAKAELNPEQAMVLLLKLGITELPAFLPQSVHDQWAASTHDWRAGGDGKTVGFP
jgi:hypothetical protein